MKISIRTKVDEQDEYYYRGYKIDSLVKGRNEVDEMLQSKKAQFEIKRKDGEIVKIRERLGAGNNVEAAKFIETQILRKML